MRFSILIIIITFFIACANEPNHSNAAPNSVAQVHFSKEELGDLAKAKGREVREFSKSDFDLFLLENEVVIFHLNQLDDVETFKTLESLEIDFEGAFKLIHLIKAENQTAVNLFLRTNNLASEAFILKNSFKELGVDNPKEAQILVRSKTDEISFQYDLPLSKGELLALLQPVTLQ